HRAQMARAALPELLEGQRDHEAIFVHRAADREVDRVFIGAFLADQADQRRVGRAVVVLANARDALAAAVLADLHARHRVGDALADAAAYARNDPARSLRRLGKENDRIVPGGAPGRAADQAHPVGIGP